MRTEHVDVCVIGSGAGGAIVAYEAAKKGLRVLVLERGPYMRTAEMSSHEFEMIPRLYKDGGLQTNTTFDFFIMQGSCVGGSTVLSNMVLMRPAESVFARWERKGAGLDREKLAASFTKTEEQLEARRQPEFAISKTSRLFEQSAQAIGFTPQKMLKALGDCHACGNCNIGCIFGSKKSALTTYIPWAEELGARVLPRTEVKRIKLRRGQVEHVEAVTGAEREALRVVARTTVVAGGAIGSSAILLSSGLRKNVGTRLAFNAGAMLVAEFDETLDSYDADQMTTYLKGDDFIIEATHNPIMSAALTTPGWFREHARTMRHSRNLGYAGVMIGTEPTARVVMSPWFGHEETRFRPTDRDMRSLRGGLKVLARIFFKAGARKIHLPVEDPAHMRSEAELGLIDERIQSLRGVQSGSSHPQGGNPMSDDPELGVVGTDFAVHGVKGLFVCDASVFPDSVEVNPMHTVMALAQYGAPQILAQA